MATPLDLTVLPLHRRDGIDQPNLPGVHIATPPRRTARGRGNDRLVLYVNFFGNVRVPPQQHAELLASLAESYYDKSGTVTSALKAQAESLNDFLLQRNLRGGKSGQQVTGFLTQLVIRDNVLYMAQSGPAHGFLLSPNHIDHWYDPQTAGRGLGLSRTAPVRYFQSSLEPGNLLLVTAELPKEWNDTTIKGAHGQPLASLRRRFLGQAGHELSAILVEAQAGQGQLSLVRSPAALERVAPETKAPAETPPQRPTPTPAPKPRIEPGPEQPQAQPWEPVEQTPTTPPATPPVSTPQAARPLASEPVQRSATVSSSPIEEPHEQPQFTVGQPKRGNPLAGAGLTMIEVARRFSGATGNFILGARRWLTRMLPVEEDFELPGRTMAFIAVGVPVVVITVALVVWLQIGRVRQFDQYFSSATTHTEFALTVAEGDEKRKALTDALFYLDIAEQFQKTDETAVLRDQAQEALDDLDGIRRLDFSAALTSPLSNNATITQMVASGTDLYMLNSWDGSVSRAFLTGSGYELDRNFSCNPGGYGAIIVSDLVDIAAMPRDNEEGAAIVAMDGNGNLLYCLNEDSPFAVQLVTPDSQWGQPLAMNVEEGDLYILDPLTNAVWIYFGGTAAFRDAPRFFFANQVPAMGDTIDLALNRDELYLLHSDGGMTTCQFGASVDTPTRCTDPAFFVDNRNGDTVEQMPETSFVQIVRTPPPEPSIFLLDELSNSIYHFSLRLNLIQQYRSINELPDEAVTALAISPSRSIFLALGNQVYSAQLP